MTDVPTFTGQGRYRNETSQSHETLCKCDRKQFLTKQEHATSLSLNGTTSVTRWLDYFSTFGHLH